MATSVLNFRRVINAVLLVGGLGLCYLLVIVTTPGEFTKWSEWNKCSVTCGEGFQTRYRTCTQPKPGMFGFDCTGESQQKKVCSQKPCPQNGGYSEWLQFSNCDRACGGGKRVRKRLCTNPLPMNGGSHCHYLGPDAESQACNGQPCPVNGGYSDWGQYSACDLAGKECGKGKKHRSRTCNKPVPAYGGKPCKGADKETAECEVPCPTTAQANSTNAAPTAKANTTISTKKS